MSDYTKDLLERIIRTFLVTFLGAVLAAAPSGGISLAAVQAAALAGIAAVGSLILGLLSKPIGDTESASIL
jgi:hypothetical protein